MCQLEVLAQVIAAPINVSTLRMDGIRRILLLKDCENHVISGFAACKKFQKELALIATSKAFCHYGNTSTAAGAQLLHQLRTQVNDCMCV